MNIISSQKGIGLISVTIAMLIIFAIASASPAFYIALKSRIIEEEQKIAAINLASSQIQALIQIAGADAGGNIASDELISGSYTEQTDDLDSLNPASSNYDISYVIQNGGWNEDGGASDVDYKVITVTCEYDNGNKEIVLTGYIVGN